MRRILIKESEIRNYVRSLIRESMEMEGHASPKTIQRWLNATPEEIASWKPEGTQDPTEFADLQKMALRQPYNRTHLAQAARDIEDAWRIHNGLKSFKDWIDPETGKKLRKINSVDAKGNPIFGSKTDDERKAAHREIAKMGKRESDAKKKEIRQAEKEAQKAEQERFAEQERESEAEREMQEWCQENNIDPTLPQAKEMYAKHIKDESDKWFYDHGLDEFSYKALKRREAWLETKIKETKYSSDSLSKRIYDSCLYVLNDVHRMLNQYFTVDGIEKRRNLKKYDDNSIDNEIDSIDNNAKTAAEEDIYGKDSEFLRWCKKYDCDVNEQTKSIFDSYMAQYQKWCSDNGMDINDPSTKSLFDEIYSEYLQKQLNGVKYNSLTTPQNTHNDEKENYHDTPMYDDDGLSGRRMRQSMGQWDNIDDDDDDDHFRNYYDEEEWN